MNRSALGGVALLLVIATATSCSDDPETASNPEPSPSDTPRSTAPPTPEPPTAGAKALAQLKAYLDVRDDALRTLKVNRKRLDKVAGGQEYTSIQQRVIEYASNNFTLSGHYGHTLDVPLDRGASVRIVDCEDESGVEFLTQAGKPVMRSLQGKKIPEARSVEYNLEHTEGRWLVTSSAYVMDGNQVQSC